MLADEDAPDRAAAPAGRPLRLLVVDADRRVRTSLVGLLDLAVEVEVVASAGHARAAVDACEACRPDVVVIDPRLPELPDGVAFIRRLRAEHPEVHVVALAWAPGLDTLLGDDPGVRVVGPDGGELGDRILEALRIAPDGSAGTATSDAKADRPGPDARLGATA
jgi:hypothetical protein